jgi:uncharacterized protein
MISRITSMSRWCASHAKTTIAITFLLCVAALWLTLTRMSMNTNTNALFDQSLPFLKADAAFNKQFPQDTDTLLAVIDAPSAGHAADAASKLATRLRTQPDMFLHVTEPGGGRFFVKNGLLYLNADELAAVSTSMAKAQPLLGALVADPSLRGLFRMTDLVLDGALRGETGVEAAAPTLLRTAEALNNAIAGNSAQLDWNALFSQGNEAATSAARAYVMTSVRLDSDAVLQGEAPMLALRAAARAAGLTVENGYKVRLTGSVALDHEEFGTIETGISISAVLSLVLIVVIVFLALRFGRLVFATLITLLMGLVLSAGWAAISVGELNLISVAFTVMFLGLAVDFGIQFCMRLREQRYQSNNAVAAMESSIVITAAPLLMAGLATALGFFAFLPTKYKGVSDLGIIAGGGIFIAYLLTVTLLPALITLLPPGAEAKPAGYQFTKGFNRWLIANRKRVLGLAVLVTIAALMALPWLRFDFDPLKLKDQKTESVQTLMELIDDPLSAPYTMNILVKNEAEARALVARLQQLPSVDKAMSLFDLVPSDQENSRLQLDDLAFTLGPALDPPQASSATGADVRSAGKATRAKLAQYLNQPRGSAAMVHASDTFARALERMLRLKDDQLLLNVSHRLLGGFAQAHATLVGALSPQNISLADIPPDVKASWVAADGRIRVQVFPKTKRFDAQNIQNFVHDVRGIAPDAVGPPLTILESGKIVINAFMIASVLACMGTALLLWLTLRNFGDVLRTVGPLLLAGVWTLGLCAAIDFPINFANIIGLPLLLGIGITYPVYHVIAWRAGDEELLSSPMARGVFFSALTTMAAFGTLALSAHPGTAGMGILLSIALTFALAATYLVLPALLGKAPPEQERISEGRYTHG